jgi:diguanylate cyclase (GGDEF)-like protein
MQRQPRTSPLITTVVLTTALATCATILTVLAGNQPAFTIGPNLSFPVAVGVLAAMFAMSELELIHVEFRRQAYSYTLAGIPIVLGLAVCGTRDVVIGRIVGSAAAFAFQRPSLVKVAFNISAFAFEVAADGYLIHHLTHDSQPLTAGRAAALYMVVATLDLVISSLVLLVISVHQGMVDRRVALDVLLPALVFTAGSVAFAFAGLLLTNDGTLGYLLLAALAVAGLGAYRSYRTLHRRHESLAMVHDFIENAAPELVAEQVSETLLARIRQLMNATRIELTIVRHGIATRLAVTEEGAVESSPEAPDADGDWLLARVRTQGEPVLVPRNAHDRGLQLWLRSHNFHDALVVPLRSSTMNGTLVVSDRMGEASSFTNDDLTLLQTLAGHLTVALQNARLLDRLRYEATHDTLTGLTNRALLRRTLQDVLVAPREHEVAVLLIDLDRFKEVNDAFGHHVGDELLKEVARRLLAAAPDGATVARLGGDEFAVLLPPQADILAAADAVARDIVAAVFEPAKLSEVTMPLSEATVNTQVSVGIAISNPSANHVDVLRNADTAMYAAKSHDDSIVVYDPELDRGRAERLALGADLQLALSRDELVLHYQPKLDLATGAMSGVEALVRWNHPRLGTLNPETFIPLAETNGLIEQLTPFVLRMALKQCRLWRDAGFDITVAVNLSARNVGNPQLPETVSRALDDAGLPADRLVLEITESSVMDDPERTVPILVRLASTGVTLSLDDFGTGYSSLSYLQRLPVREVKIDRSFVRGLADPDDARASEALIRSIAGLGESLQLNIVAEGVEDAKTIDLLRQYGCDVAQGYFIGRPEPADRITARLREVHGTRPHLKAIAN